MLDRPIQLKNVRQNNLKGINVDFPARKITVITGVSGSGKSSLAFETLYAEGQRRYVESLSTYTRQFLEKMPKPDLESIKNIPPAIALEQRNHIVNSRSTVGTQTEINDYLRVLFAKIGHTFCENCDTEVQQLNTEVLLDWAMGWLPNRKALILAPFTKTLDKTVVAKGKTPTKSAPKRMKQIDLTTTQILLSLKQQGYQRLFRPEGRILEIEELLENPSLVTDPIYVVIDRLRVSESLTEETRSRILDSVEQAIALGQGKVGFFDLDQSEWREFDQQFMCKKCGKVHRKPEENHFSFNSPLGACSHCSGFGYTLDFDESLVVPDLSKTLKNGAIDPLSKPSLSDWQIQMFRFAEKNGISIGKRYRELSGEEKKMLWQGDDGSKGFPGIRGCFEELKRFKYKLHVRVFLRRYQSQTLCKVCFGKRLSPGASLVRIEGKNFSDLLDLSIYNLFKWFSDLELSTQDREIGGELISQLMKRLRVLNEVGVGYLSLSRLAKTLSGGEFQRINLATQLGSGLCGTLYVLDEPSIGLHAMDTERLIRILRSLRDLGNTVVLVEHDLDVIRAADWIVELGPGAGRRGGELVVQGSLHQLIETPGSLTGKYLNGAFSLRNQEEPERKKTRGDPLTLRLTGCRENNLKEISVEFPLSQWVVVTGVSGSGKSTLVHQTLSRCLQKLFNRENLSMPAMDRLYGAENLSGVVMLDQTPIGKNSRSNPATYMNAWDEVRRIFATQALAIRRGLTPQYFSFNVDGGRCTVCRGEGEITLDMHFMAEIRLPCEECGGKRFKKNILDIQYKNKNIYQILRCTIDEAFEIFRENSNLVRKLGILREVGLGYLGLGQSATTLSGGESQRLKIASVLDDRDKRNHLYIFDEPSTGLHLEDIKKLLIVIRDLVEAGNSVIMVEHHLDIIQLADWVIDLGPGGGEDGGNVVFAGRPQKLVQSNTLTGQMLRKYLGLAQK